MYLKIAVCLALLCIAKASFIDNVVETDDDTTSVESSCDGRECDQRCRRLGFTGGVCVGDRCKCDINVPLTEDAINMSPDVSGCIPDSCKNVCHDLGHRNAVCVSNDKCVCYEVLHFLDTTSVESSCDGRECDQRCRRLGFTGGVCVGDRCKCDINVPLTEDAINMSPDVSGCIPDSCKNVCHDLGHRNAVCVSNDKCVCYEVLHFLALEPPNCYGSTCNVQCQKMGHIGGHCIRGKCQCHASVDVSDIESSENLGKCHNKKCLEECLKKFKPGGICIFGHCRCLS